MSALLSVEPYRCDIVIPVYNALRSTRDCLASVRRNRPAWARIVVVNDGSDARTTEWLRAQEGITLLENPVNGPGVSLVAHQDFAHFYTGWIHLIHYRLRDYFDFDSEVKRSCTVLFKLKKVIPAELLDQDWALENATLAELNAAFDYSASIVSADKQEQIAAARAMAHIHRGEPELAAQVAKDFMWENIGSYLFRDQRPDLVDVRAALDLSKK